MIILGSTDRECGVCGAVVVAHPAGMSCHCKTVPWIARPATFRSERAFGAALRQLYLRSKPDRGDVYSWFDSDDGRAVIAAAIASAGEGSPNE